MSNLFSTNIKFFSTLEQAKKENFPSSKKFEGQNPFEQIKFLQSDQSFFFRFFMNLRARKIQILDNQNGSKKNYLTM